MTPEAAHEFVGGGIALPAVLRIAIATLRRKRGSLLAFAAAMFGFLFVTAAAFPAIGGEAAVTGVIGTFPPNLRRLLRIAPNLQAGFGLRDYVALSFFHPVFLGFGAAFVVGRATDALAGEVERGSIYLLLSRPVARWSLVLGKMSELLAGAGVLALAGWLGLALAAAISLDQPLPLGRYLLVALLAWPLFGALGAGALVVSALGRRTGAVAGIASAWTLVSFVLDVLPAVADTPLGLLNPWHSYDPPALVATGVVPWLGILVQLGWIIGGTGVAIAIFARRDLL